MKSELTRREFLKLSAIAGFGFTEFFYIRPPRCHSKEKAAEFSFGMVADLHYADRDMRNNRYYRDSLVKLQHCIDNFNNNELAFVVHLGDLIDKAKDKSTELSHLKSISQVFSQFKGAKHYVLGNHDLARFSKDECLDNCGADVNKSFYSFDAGNYHFVILDANFMKNGADYNSGNFKWKDTYIHAAQQNWLAQDLKKAHDKTTCIFVHQNLNDEQRPHGVNNADEIRKILEKAGNVVAVFQGHDHRGGDTKINGIHYFTLKALVDGATLQNNSFGIVSIDGNARINLQGFGKQESVRFN